MSGLYGVVHENEKLHDGPLTVGELVAILSVLDQNQQVFGTYVVEDGRVPDDRVVVRRIESSNERGVWIE